MDFCCVSFLRKYLPFDCSLICQVKNSFVSRVKNIWNFAAPYIYRRFYYEIDSKQVDALASALVERGVQTAHLPDMQSWKQWASAPEKERIRNLSVSILQGKTEWANSKEEAHAAIRLSVETKANEMLSQYYPKSIIDAFEGKLPYVPTFSEALPIEEAPSIIRKQNGSELIFTYDRPFVGNGPCQDGLRLEEMNEKSKWLGTGICWLTEPLPDGLPSTEKELQDHIDSYRSNHNLKKATDPHSARTPSCIISAIYDITQDRVYFTMEKIKSLAHRRVMECACQRNQESSLTKMRFTRGSLQREDRSPCVQLKRPASVPEAWLTDDGQVLVHKISG